MGEIMHRERGASGAGAITVTPSPHAFDGLYECQVGAELPALLTRDRPRLAPSGRTGFQGSRRSAAPPSTSARIWSSGVSSSRASPGRRRQSAMCSLSVDLARPQRRANSAALHTP